MEISIDTLGKLYATTLAEAIEEICEESDTVASGVIGSAFSTSGPGSGWTCHHDVSDFARRALDGEYGACSYIDSADGREAELNKDGDLVWSDESVVEIILPTVEEAVDNPAKAAIILDAATTYGVDEEDVDALRDKIANPYRITDGNATEYVGSLEEAKSIIEDWYDFLADDGKVDEMPTPDLDASDLDSLCASIRVWENQIAESMGSTAFAGHGNYYVSAADRAGLDLRIEIRD